MSEHIPEIENENAASDGYDYGPPRTYEITWANGHIERMQGHQLMIPSEGIFGGRHQPRWMIHGCFRSRWTCMLAADEMLILMVRDVTDGEHFGGVTI